MSTLSLFQPDRRFAALRLSGDWQVQPLPLDQQQQPRSGDWIAVPECAHLQPMLYPNQPYWGDHLRAINQQAWLYRREFAVPPGDYRRVRLRFEAVDYFAQVWIDDQLAGDHEGHFAPFDLDVTDLLHGDTGSLTVRVTSPWDAPNPSGTYPTDHVIRGLVKGLYEHGEGVIPPTVNPIGIWRPVWLLLDQGISIDRIRIRTELDGHVDLRLRLTNATPDDWQGTLDLRIDAENHDGAGVTMQQPITLSPGVHEIDRTLTIPDPRLWWSWDQGSPDLYRLAARLLDGSDQVVSRAREVFGVRTVRLERSPERFIYYLNERPVFLRGTSYMPALYLSECTRESLAGDLALARDANLNLLRVHVHVSPPELYDLCDRAGMPVWQDFELNWVQDPSPEFEQRAVSLQREMIDLLGNHPSVITWACHNEPTMVFVRRSNLEHHPDPALYDDALQQDPTRPIFICSGQIEDDWQRSGDLHAYYGAIWSSRYADIYRHHPRLCSEFGFEAPAALDTLRAHADVWDRLQHLEPQIDELWAYQAALIQYQVEHFRRLRGEGSAGYVHFWLVDLVPQVGCGVLDARRVPKGGYAALQRASLPLQIILEHDGRRPFALWIVNDLPRPYPAACVAWQVEAVNGAVIFAGNMDFDIAANQSQRVIAADWQIAPADCARVRLSVTSADGDLLCENVYDRPFQPPTRPRGYPWKFDPYLGTKVFDRPDAPSLADYGISPLLKVIPLSVRESVAERALRQRLPTRLVSLIARLGDALLK